MKTKIAAAVGVFAGCALALASVPAAAQNGSAPGGGLARSDLAPLDHEWGVAPLDHEWNFADNGSPGGGVTSAGDEYWPRNGGVAPAGDQFWPKGSGVAQAGDEIWPRGGGVASATDHGVVNVYDQGKAPWRVSPASTDGYRNLSGVDPDYPLTGTVSVLGDEPWPKGCG